MRRRRGIGLLVRSVRVKRRSDPVSTRLERVPPSPLPTENPRLE